MSPISLDEYCRTIRYTHDIKQLQSIHCEVSKELFRRLLGPMTDANLGLSGATTSQLMRILDRIFDQMMVIVSIERANRDDMRYGSRDLSGGSGG